MTLPDRATVQAVARPQLEAMFAQQGRPVDIVREGHVVARDVALLIPSVSGSRATPQVSAAELDVTHWKVFLFPAAADFLTPGFALHFPAALGQPEVQLVPLAPPVDVADQGVVLLVPCAPLQERTRVSTLTFTLPGSIVKDPVTGNSYPSAGSTFTVPVRLSASDDPRIRDMAGADAAEVVLVGRWGTLDQPRTRPPSVRWGSTSPLVVDGQNGTLTLKVAYPDADLHQEAQLGGRFVAVWTSNP